MASYYYENCLKQFFVLQCFILVYFVQSITCVSLQPGIFELSLSVNTPAAAFKSLFKDTVVHIAADTREGDYDSSGTVRLCWELRYTQCEGLYGIQLNESPEYEDTFFGEHTFMFPVEQYINVAANKSSDITFEMSTPELAFVNYTWIDWTCYVGNVSNTKFKECKQGTYSETGIEENDGTKVDKAKTQQRSKKALPQPPTPPQEPQMNPTPAPHALSAGPADQQDLRYRVRYNFAGEGEGDLPCKKGEELVLLGKVGDSWWKMRNGKGQMGLVPTSYIELDDTTSEEDGKAKKDNTKDTQTTGNSDKMKKEESADAPGKKLVQVPESGSYLLIMKLEVIAGDVKTFPVRVHMKGKHGYLSAYQYKLLPFYGIMCGLYMLMGFTWLFLMCYQYKYLMGIHTWIGSVILLGLLEKAVFFGEFEHMNNYGEESSLGILFPEIVSCIKRTLARLLVVVVSLGYGVTRTTLGNVRNYMMAAGLTYLILSSAEAIMRTNQDYERTMVAVLPLSIFDAILVWWIIRNLVNTCRELRLRQNIRKLWLYRYFTNTLLLCVLMSVIFFIWSMKTHSMNECIIKWEWLWLDDAFWHILFCVILCVTMMLFPPSSNQQYVLSPLVDDEEEWVDERKEPIVPGAYDGMKMRNWKEDNPQNAVSISAGIDDKCLKMDDSSRHLEA